MMEIEVVIIDPFWKISKNVETKKNDGTQI